MRITKSNYTLIEMLVVLVIIALLLGGSMAAINGITKRRQLVAGVRSLSKALSMAQSYAISRCTYVAFLLPDGGVSGHEPDPSGSKSTINKNDLSLYRSYGVCFVSYDSSTGKYTFYDWVPGEKWHTIPEGTSAYVKEGAEIVESVKKDGSAIGNSTAIIFRATGNLVGDTEVKVSALPARFVPDMSPPALVFQNKTEKGWIITINPFTGRAKYEKE
jgi:prepilin-type N-terminal cleavage/methylation domain-containing protein